jgi:hypothetical protein
VRCVRCLKSTKIVCVIFIAMGIATSLSAEPLPSQLAGSWKITRVLQTGNSACWKEEQARPLVGSMLNYGSHAMRWRGGEVPLQGIVLRRVTDAQFRKENTGSEGAAEFVQLGIRSHDVLEVDLQHEDADITGATTEVPGDTVLLAGTNRIIVSACGVFFEATRGGLTPASTRP